MATQHYTDSTAPTDGTNTPNASTARPTGRFATSTSPSEIASHLLDRLEDGVTLKRRARAIAMGGEAYSRISGNEDSALTAMITVVTETLEEHGWAYEIEEGLRRIEQLSDGAAPRITPQPDAASSSAEQRRPHFDSDLLDEIGEQVKWARASMVAINAAFAAREADEGGLTDAVLYDLCNGAQYLLERTQAALLRAHGAAS
jgi:hypothetical protein